MAGIISLSAILDNEFVEIINKNSFRIKSFSLDFEFLNKDLCQALPNTLEVIIINQLFLADVNSIHSQVNAIFKI